MDNNKTLSIYIYFILLNKNMETQTEQQNSWSMN